MQAGRRQTKFERENNLQRIADFYLRGWRQVDIAAEVKLTQQQIAYDLKVIQQRWRESSIVDMNEAKQRELARIDVLEREYWDAWERSQGERSKMRQTRRGEDQSLSVEKEIPVGNPAFLAGVQWCIAERSKILGLYAATQNEISGKGGHELVFRVVYGVPDPVASAPSQAS
jgi:hypothetical protein